VPLARYICYFKRLSHASVSISLYDETADGSISSYNLFDYGYLSYFYTFIPLKESKYKEYC
jgi:hypothetical protein